MEGSKEQKELTKGLILYLVKTLGKSIEGRKKLMKLMFLIEHYNLSKKTLDRIKVVGNNFIIYHYGVFSFDVLNSYLDLINEGKLKDDFPMEIKIVGKEGKLPGEIKVKVDGIIKKFGKKSGKELEIYTLDLLGLSLETKKQKFGESVESFIV